VDVIAFHDHVAQIYTDPKFKRLVGIVIDVSFSHPVLNFRGTPYGINDAGKLDKQPVAHLLDQPAPVLGDHGFNKFTEVRIETGPGSRLVRAHKPRITDHVSGKDRGKAT
jgi:hypothetical protein